MTFLPLTLFQGEKEQTKCVQVEIQKEWVLLRRNLPVPLNQLDKNFWKLFYSPHDVKK